MHIIFWNVWTYRNNMEKDDKLFAKLLNRLCIGTYTNCDTAVLDKCKIL